MGDNVLFLFVIFITLVAFGSAAKVTVKIHERRLLSCSTSSDPENVKHIGWYRCYTDDCANDWDKFRIAHVKNMRVTIPDNPNFEVYTNGTLVIKKVLPVDDRKMFICIAQKTLIGRERSTTILHIAKEPPQLTRESPPEPQVLEGNDLHLDVRVQGYPFPWVTWSHGDHLLQNKSVKDSETRLKIRNVTVLEGGRYTCYAKNPFGHDILTFDVTVEGQSVRTTAEPGDSSLAGWIIATIVVGPLLVVIITILIIILCILKKKCRSPKLHLNRLFRRCLSNS
ncbi:protein sidekick-2-like isoform X1 [Pocillopora verrucosa]|uniref:protein sidekick-2-like isoform X1 n=1 Tax=Pocillopora verrucosa TaxID=203993 RepID=UPI0033412059